MHPQPEQESIFRTVFAGWLRLEVYLDGFFRATTKKKVVNFFGKKCSPQTKSWLRLWLGIGYAFNRAGGHCSFKQR